MTVIPLWRHLSYNPRQTRLRLISNNSPQIIEKCLPALRLVKSSGFNDQSSESYASCSPTSQLDYTFICPVTSQRLPDCSCIHSSLKLHDFCVFCPAVKLSESSS